MFQREQFTQYDQFSQRGETRQGKRKDSTQYDQISQLGKTRQGKHLSSAGLVQPSDDYVMNR